MRVVFRSHPRRHGWMLWMAIILALACFWGMPSSSRSKAPDTAGSEVTDALAAIGLDHDLKLGYALRQDTWGGDLPVGTAKRIQYQLFKENEYRFCAWTSTKHAKISLHICDPDGNALESRIWQKTLKNLSVAGADIHPSITGSIYLTVKIDESPEERTSWGMVYAYR